MAEFNLIDQPWIKVIVDEKGKTKEVSLRELFQQAHGYVGLGGETETQNFAILRLLLAIGHTVFGRVNARGECHEEYFPNGIRGDKSRDSRFKPGVEESIEDIEDYVEELFTTWEAIWKSGQWPEFVEEYLDTWYDRFYLIGGEYPFYQVSHDFMKTVKPNLADPLNKSGRVYGKAINRVLTESENKIALFASKVPEMKDRLSLAEIARWMITFHGYTGTGDKQVFRKGRTGETWSKGWLYDLGGIYAVGDNLFETLMLNLVLVHPEEEYRGCLQRPFWEFSHKEIFDKYLNQPVIDNLAELYSIWSRVIYIDPKQDFQVGFYCSPVKLLEVHHPNQFLEPMTLWRYREEKSESYFLPKKHIINQSLWRSFGIIAQVQGDNREQNKKKPGIIDWLEMITDPGDSMLEDDSITLCGVSMESDGNASSWTPVNEIYNEMNINERILLGKNQEAWRNRIHDEIDLVKYIIERIYGGFLRNIERIRYGEGKGNFVNRKKEEAYFLIDQPFKNWLEDIHEDDNMDDKCREWRKIFRKIMIEEGNKNLQGAGTRDYTGIDTKEGLLNLPIALNFYRASLNKKLGQEAKDE